MYGPGAGARAQLPWIALVIIELEDELISFLMLVAVAAGPHYSAVHDVLLSIAVSKGRAA
jgi:hypothetical protein